MGPVTDDRPLVMTLLLDEPTQQRFERERRALFPPGRTQVGAHVTLFHALPPELYGEVVAALGEVPGPVAVEVTGVRSLGRGAAYDLTCPDLVTRHRQWQGRWRDRLTRQDAQAWRPHVTVQNKVDPDTARRTVAELSSAFAPWTATGVALEVWRYDGGPWTHLERVLLG